MSILITGANGFVGSHLVSFLKQAGFDALTFDGDICDRQMVLNYPINKKIDAVIHLAGVLAGRDRSLFQKINVDGTKNIVDFCQKLNAGRLVFMSSLKVLSAQRNDPYVNSKKAAEKMVAESGCPYIILRPAMIYGPGDNKNISFLLRLIKTLPVAPVFNFRLQPVFVDDAVLAITKCLDLPPNKIINMAGQETISYAGLLEFLKNKGYKIHSLNAPGLFNLLLEIFSYLPFSPLPHWQVATLLADEIFAEYGWLELFKIKPSSLSEGLTKMI